MRDRDEMWEKQKAARGKPCPLKVGDALVWINDGSTSVGWSSGIGVGHGFMREVPCALIPGVVIETYEDVPSESDHLSKLAAQMARHTSYEERDFDPWYATVEWRLPDGHKLTHLVRPEYENTDWRRA